MNTIELLKKLINIYYYLLLIGFVGIVIFMPILFKNGKVNNLNILEGYNASDISMTQLITFLLVPAIIFVLFIRAVYLLKETLKDLAQGDYFSELVINNFKNIGKLILICGISYWVYEFVLRLLLLSDVKLGLNYSLITPIIIGLFFMFLSEVFAKARKTEEENNLTI